MTQVEPAPATPCPCGMLADGTNPEGVDPVPPLSWSTLASLQPPVIVFGGSRNPPVFKVRLHLAYRQVKYRCVRRRGGKKATHLYGKIPVIKVAGREVNDSFIILKHLVPVLWGEPFNEEMEGMLTFGLQLAMEAEIFEDPASAKALLRMARRPPNLYKHCCCCILPIGRKGAKFPARIRARRALLDERWGPLKTLQQYLVAFEGRLQGGRFYAGRSEPGQVDVSCYGTMKMMELPVLLRAIDRAGLAGWWSEMNRLMPDIAGTDVWEDEPISAS